MTKKSRPPELSWEGGYKRPQKDGDPIFIIERRVGTTRFHISTRTHSRRAALEHLDRFERDPWAYAEEMKYGRRDAKTVYLTDELVEEFAAWLVERDHPTTQKYANEMEHRLSDWADDLSGRDLRHVDLATLKRCVDKREGSRQHRIIAIKSFCGWLRTEKFLLDRKTDASIDLAVPQAEPEQWKRRKAIPVEDVRAVVAQLAPAYRDCLLVLGATGMHVTELERFARDAESGVGLDPLGRCPGVLSFRHKTGKPHNVAIHDADALEAAKRIRARGEIPRKLNSAIRTATAAVNEKRPAAEQITGFGAGKGAGKMRHSVATWGLSQGDTVETVAKHLGHTDDGRTTERHYIDSGIPRVVLKLPKLT